MSVKIIRAVVCDTPGCPNASIDVLRTAEQEPPDWQGWAVKMDAALGEKHYCPDCSNAVPIPASVEWTA